MTAASAALGDEAAMRVALDEARAAGRLQDGDIVAMTAFGTGFTWAAQVLRV